jgi:outer membrane protein TolC
VVSELLLLILPALPADTVHVPMDSAFALAVERSFDLRSAAERATAAEAQARQTAGIPNPDVAVQIENIGRAREVTGFAAPEGLEGQVYLQTTLPFGPARGGAIDAARADSRAAAATAEEIRLRAAEETAVALAALRRSRRLVELAREEASTLRALMERLDLEAEVGTSAEGDAARVRLEYGMVATRLGRLEVQWAERSADVARRIGFDPAVPIVLDDVPCTVPARDVGDPREAPVVAAARARVAAAEGRARIATSLALPDVLPQAGLRRGAGVSAFYLGLQMSLPVLNRGGAARSAAEAERRAAEIDLAAAEAAWAAERAATRRGLEALVRAGEVYDADWTSALERAIEASERRFEVGEGSLFELLDQRRARLRALEDRELWVEQVRGARARAARVNAIAPDASLFCLDTSDGIAR